MLGIATEISADLNLPEMHFNKILRFGRGDYYEASGTNWKAFKHDTPKHHHPYYRNGQYAHTKQNYKHYTVCIPPFAGPINKTHIRLIGLTLYIIETPFDTFANRAGPEQAVLCN